VFFLLRPSLFYFLYKKELVTQSLIIFL